MATVHEKAAMFDAIAASFGIDPRKASPGFVFAAVDHSRRAMEALRAVTCESMLKPELMVVPEVETWVEDDAHWQPARMKAGK